MSRATSAGLYGSGTPVDMSRVPARRPARAYGLRSASSVTGYYPAYGSRPRRKARTEQKVNADPVTGIIGPVVPDDEDVPVVRREVDYGAERRLVPTIRMADF